MNETQHLSHSQISTYLTCPLRYKFHYVDQIPPEFTAAALVFGQAIHEAAAAFYQAHLEGDALRKDQLQDVYQDTWRGRESEVKFFNGDNPESLDDKAKQLLTVFHDSFDPTVKILGVEEFFEAPLGNNGTPPLHGYIDLIEEDKEGRVAVVDLKTASRKPSAFEVHNHPQLTAYSLGAAALGFDPSSIEFRLDVLLKTKNPELVRCTTLRTERNRQRFISTAKAVWNAIIREAWFPRQDWHCAQCAYAQPCKDW